MKLYQMTIISKAICRNRNSFRNLSDLSLEDLKHLVADLQAAVTALNEFCVLNPTAIQLNEPIDTPLSICDYINAIAQPLKHESEFRELQLSIFDGEHLE